MVPATFTRAYLDGLDAETFDLDAYLAQFDPRLLGDSEGRRTLTRLDPLLFALVFVRHHLRDSEGQITFGDAHLDWCRAARGWVRPVAAPSEQRDAYIAPRNMGKSTWWFLILPMWAAAHGHVKFAAAFASSAGQAETHLGSFKREIDTNELLRQDFADLCSPARRPSGTNVADTQSMFVSKAGFVFAARGIDSSNLGMKVGEQRPDLLLCDDIEPDESSYSADQASKRRTTLIDSILPLNVYARVVISGTVTMPGSIVHQLTKHARGVETAEWISEEGFRAHYTPPIVQRDDGTERSVWPAKWPLAYLKSIEHTRSFAKNMSNDPMGADGDLWTPDDFRYPDETGPDPITHMMLSIDPAVTAKKSSDFTGLAVVSWSAQHRRCTVHAAAGIKVQPGPLLRERVLAILDEFPQIGLILIEVNQGGDTWQAILHGMPVKVKTVQQTENKFTRAEGVLNHYQRGRVIHARRLVELEQQMCAFPKAPHDDMVDATGSAIRRFIPNKQREASKASSASYL
ncbi:phage terminase large subunit family protein [Streptomyces sp. NPDC005071]